MSTYADKIDHLDRMPMGRLFLQELEPPITVVPRARVGYKMHDGRTYGIEHEGMEMAIDALIRDMRRAWTWERMGIVGELERGAMHQWADAYINVHL